MKVRGEESRKPYFRTVNIKRKLSIERSLWELDGELSIEMSLWELDGERVILSMVNLGVILLVTVIFGNVVLKAWLSKG